MRTSAANIALLKEYQSGVLIDAEVQIFSEKGADLFRKKCSTILQIFFKIICSPLPLHTVVSSWTSHASSNKLVSRGMATVLPDKKATPEDNYCTKLL